METIDVLVVGGGIVGLAIARELAIFGREVIVAEKESMPCSVTSSRNSGVIHAGIYYPPGSFKAKLCVEGKEKLYNYVENRHIPYRNCSKLIVASNKDEEIRLKTIKARAEANGVNDLNLISAREASALEPELQCHAALRSPSTGIIEVHDLMLSFIADLEAHKGFIALGNTVQSANVTEGGISVCMEDGSQFKANLLINTAGLDAPALAKKISGSNQNIIPQYYLAKGNYFSLSGKAPFSRLIYPVPENGGLGVHYTLNIKGESIFGPDVEWLTETDNLSANKISYDVDPVRADRFYHSIARYWPDIRSRTLSPGYSGIRPKVSGPGEAAADFIIHTLKDHGAPGLVNLYGIESPGLTASMAIASYIQQSL